MTPSVLCIKRCKFSIPPIFSVKSFISYYKSKKANSCENIKINYKRFNYYLHMRAFVLGQHMAVPVISSRELVFLSKNKNLKTLEEKKLMLPT